MQTFLPFADIVKSLNCLDNKRLGKQRVEAFQLLCALDYYPALQERKRRLPDAKPLVGWKTHPAAIMWKGFEGCLTAYYNASINEWLSRGFNNTLKHLEESDYRFPDWWGDKKFHLSHQSNLLRKDFAHYSKYFSAPLDLPYVWPGKV